MLLISFWSNLTRKDSVESAKYEEKKKYILLLKVLGGFFMDPVPDFSRSDPDFQPIRIRTQDKKFDLDPEKIPDPT